MEALGDYLFQMACWLTGFLLIYTAVLRKETFFNLNRWFLLTGLFVSIVIPFFPIHYEVMKTTTDLPVLLTTGEVVDGMKTKTSSLLNPWFIAYSLGFLFFVIRFLIQIAKLRRIRNMSERIVLGSTPVYKLDKDTSPFSFFNSIFVSKKLCSDTELKTVIVHEKVHIDERHWADLLLLEMVRALQWFNPLLILYRKAVMQNHEFLADSGTLRNGVSAHTYKVMLANQMLGIPVLQFANGFTLFNPNKRILMMSKDKTSPLKRLKLLWALPLIALLLGVFAEPKFVSGENPVNGSLATDKTITVKGKVVDQDGNPLPGTSIIIANTTSGTVSDADGNYTISGVLPENEIFFSFVGFETVQKKVKSELNVSMKKKIYAIESNNLLAPPPPPPPVNDIVIGGPGCNANGEKPLVVLDGKIFGNIEDVNIDNVASMNVLKGEVALKKYGDKGKNGVIEITSKEVGDQQKEEFFVIVEEMPQYPGGEAAMADYISKATLGSKEKGIVYVTFIVSKEGNIKDAKVIRNSTENLNKKALEIVYAMPKWNPGSQHGKTVDVAFTLKIEF